MPPLEKMKNQAVVLLDEGALDRVLQTKRERRAEVDADDTTSSGGDPTTSHHQHHHHHSHSRPHRQHHHHHHHQLESPTKRRRYLRNTPELTTHPSFQNNQAIFLDEHQLQKALQVKAQRRKAAEESTQRREQTRQSMNKLIYSFDATRMTKATATAIHSPSTNTNITTKNGSQRRQSSPKKKKSFLVSKSSNIGKGVTATCSSVPVPPDPASTISSVGQATPSSQSDALPKKKTKKVIRRVVRKVKKKKSAPSATTTDSSVAAGGGHTVSSSTPTTARSNLTRSQERICGQASTPSSQIPGHQEQATPSARHHPPDMDGESTGQCSRKSTIEHKKGPVSQERDPKRTQSTRRKSRFVASTKHSHAAVSTLQDSSGAKDNALTASSHTQLAPTSQRSKKSVSRSNKPSASWIVPRETALESKPLHKSSTRELPQRSNHTVSSLGDPSGIIDPSSNHSQQLPGTSYHSQVSSSGSKNHPTSWIVRKEGAASAAGPTLQLSNNNQAFAQRRHSNDTISMLEDPTEIALSSNHSQRQSTSFHSIPSTFPKNAPTSWSVRNNDTTGFKPNDLITKEIMTQYTENLGGVETVAATTKIFYDKAKQDPEINLFFKNIRWEHVRNEFIILANLQVPDKFDESIKGILEHHCKLLENGANLDRVIALWESAIESSWLEHHMDDARQLIVGPSRVIFNLKAMERHFAMHKKAQRAAAARKRRNGDSNDSSSDDESVSSDEEHSRRTRKGGFFSRLRRR